MLMWLHHLLGCIISWSCGGQCHLAAWNMLHTSAFTYTETGSTLGGPATLDRLKGVDRVRYLRMIYILTINHKTHRIIHSRLTNHTWYQVSIWLTHYCTYMKCFITSDDGYTGLVVLDVCMWHLTSLVGCYHTSVFTIWRHMQYLGTCHHWHWKL